MNTQDIGNYIRDKRKLQGYESQEAFALELGVSTKTVGSWERGDFKSIMNENLEKLSKVLHVSISEIYLGRDMTGLDEETKILLDQEIKSINERVDNVQTITIKVEDRGLLSMEIGIYAFGFSVVAIALAWWAASPRTPLISTLCLILGLFGIGFVICGKRVIRRLAKRVQKERDQDKEN